MPRYLRPLAVAAMVTQTPALAQAPVTPQTVRFGASPGMYGDFEITRDTTIVHGGRASVRIRAGEEPSGFANLSAIVAAEPWVGHRIRFSVFLRSASLVGGGGALWARADNSNHQSVAFINTQTSPLRGTNDWTQASLSLDIPAGAAQLFVGVMSLGAGSLWVDDAHLEADGVTPIDVGFETSAEFTAAPPMPRAPVVREAARALSTRGLANVSAFAEALGYVRFFHPSPEAVRVNWDAFAVRGMRAVESATTPDRLVSSLRTLFAPIAPTVRFVRTGSRIRPAAGPANATHAVFWRHFGVGTPSGGGVFMNPQSIYRSERVVVPLADVGKPVDVSGGYRTLVSQAHVPDPAHPVSVKLEGGVTMSVPVALYTTDSTVADSSLRMAHPASTSERFVAGDRATRLAAVALAWSLFEHFYPYFGVVHTDWLAARTAALRGAATDRDANAFDATMDRLIAALHDGHGRVNRLGRTLATTDVQLSWAEGHVIVTAVGDSAAAHGVRRGDEIIGVDGRPISNVLADKSSRISGATAQWVRSRAVSELLAGDIGTAVQLRLLGADGATREAQILRGARTTPSAPAPDKIAEVASGTMYVDLGRITDSDFVAALPKLEAARSIIFDMRGYPRQVNTPGIFAHLTDSVIHSAHFQTPIITMPKFRDVGYVDGAWTIPPAAPRLRGRIVFLSGGGAISYAESTLGIVEAYKLGDVVGEASAGTNGNVNPFALPGGYTVSWTGMLVKKRDGTPHHGVGIRATVPVSPTVAGVRAGRDEVLERAIELVKPRA